VEAAVVRDVPSVSDLIGSGGICHLNNVSIPGFRRSDSVGDRGGVAKVGSPETEHLARTSSVKEIICQCGDLGNDTL
jgi:hypothetical protein